MFKKIKKKLKSLKFKLHRKTEGLPIGMVFSVLSLIIIIVVTLTISFQISKSAFTDDANSPVNSKDYDAQEQIEIASFENDVLNKISNNDDKKFLLTFYLKDTKSEFYILKDKKDNLKPEERSKLTDLFKSVQFGKEKDILEKFGDILWWAFVTATTVGYGDIFPNTLMGRVAGVTLMGLGIFLTTILSGTIASIFVERKLKEGKGMKELTIKEHIVICGWNERGENIIKSLPYAMGNSDITLVLVNELDEMTMSDLKMKFEEIEIKFVHGDFTREEILKRANIEKAKSVLILADSSGDNAQKDSDQRTVIAAFAIKNLAADVKIAAELNKKENEEHLRRANVEDIIIYGDFGGYLLSQAAVSPGVPSMLRELLSFTIGNTIMLKEIPSEYINKTFKDLGEYFRTKTHSIAIGVLSQEKDITLDDILSDDSVSAIDQFIKKKFSEAQEDYFGQEKPQYFVRLNPGDNYVIQKIDTAFVITKAIP